MDESQNHYAKEIMWNQKETYYVIPVVGHYGKGKFYDRKLVSCHQMLVEGRGDYKKHMEKFWEELL